MAFANDGAIQRVKSGEQRRRSISPIIVRLAFGQTRPQRQDGLRAVERLNLALLIYAQHQGMIGRVHIQAHNVAHFFDQQRIGRQLECVGPMWLQAEGAPNPADRHPAKSSGLC